MMVEDGARVICVGLKFNFVMFNGFCENFGRKLRDLLMLGHKFDSVLAKRYASKGGYVELSWLV